VYSIDIDRRNFSVSSPDGKLQSLRLLGLEYSTGSYGMQQFVRCIDELRSF
jgi:hypothetical protein